MLPRSNYLVFGQPLIGGEEIDEVVDSLRRSWLGTGPKVARFEENLAAYKRWPRSCVVAVNSCTAGLHLTCCTLGLKAGDEVIAPALTFCATVNAIIHSGATPVLADVDERTFNLDPVSVEQRITEKTRAIMPVHFAGRACEMDSLLEIARRHNLKVIEDCAHAVETEYHGRPAGTMGDGGVLSFYATKNVVTGEGGAVLAPNDDVAAKIKSLALHGMSHDAWKRFSDSGYIHYDLESIGFKYNMMDLQAAIGIHQLARVEACWLKRQLIWQRYQKALAASPLILPPEPEPGTRHAYHLYSVLVDPERCGIGRDELMLRLHRLGIGTGVHYRSLPSYSIYQQRFGWRADEYPRARRVGETTVSLPLSARLTDEDVDDVIAALAQSIPKWIRR